MTSACEGSDGGGGPFGSDTQHLRVVVSIGVRVRARGMACRRGCRFAAAAAANVLCASAAACAFKRDVRSARICTHWNDIMMDGQRGRSTLCNDVDDE